MKLLTTTIVIASLALSGCVHVTPTEKAKLAEAGIVTMTCKTFKRMTYDGKLDTQPTKDQIKRYNAARKGFGCPVDKESF